MNVTDANLLVVGNDPAGGAFMATFLEGSGWHVARADAGPDTFDMIESDAYDLLLVDCTTPSGFDAARTIRQKSCPLPILALIATDREDMTEITAAEMDGHVTRTTTTDALLATLAPWRREPPDPTRLRLAGAFGQAAFGSLVSNFERQLAEALAILNADTRKMGIAHRIAGIAGTLGFAELSQTWLALSEGDHAMVGPARLAARRALVAISRERRVNT